ncbi:hypothetical protein VKT23_011667 [Stygiomarasmius scandens]|uniref:Uncharacterized protein n=1 Tax=Marasmiellus scandens TaxID=2682957 RepID=A0ABR1J7Q9_9AGAR
MTSKSLFNGISVSSPTRTLGKSLGTPISASSPRSILKRPPPLMLSPIHPSSKQLSPLVLSANLTVLITPSKASPTVTKANRKSRNLTVTITSPSSPHVHFPPSAHLTSTFAAHSSECYDRTAIKVSPNPLEIPSWGSRVYSPSTGSFKDSEQADVTERDSEATDGLMSRRFRTSKASPFTPPILLTSSLGITSPLSQSFTELPFSPRPNRTRASIRFQNITALNSLDSLQPLSHQDGNRLSNGGDRQLKAFPRSPYPVPMSPVLPTLESNSEVEVYEDEILPLSPLPSAPMTSSTPRNRSWLMSPSPKDPFACLPSFSLVLEEASEEGSGAAM